MKQSQIIKYQPILIVIFASLLSACGAAATPQIIEDTTAEPGITIRLAEAEPVEKIIQSIEIPLNNCDGNSPLTVTEERSREFVSAVSDARGGEFGVDYYFLLKYLEDHYNIRGEKETQTSSVHMMAQANSHVVYTLVWKEVLVRGDAVVDRGGDKREIPYQVKTALKLEVEDSRDIGCGQ